MDEFLGITKRKWLAFGICSLIIALVVLAGFIAIFQNIYPLDVLLILFLTLAILIAMEFITKAAASRFRVKLKRRYLASALIFILILIFGFQRITSPFLHMDVGGVLMIVQFIFIFFVGPFIGIPLTAFLFSLFFLILYCLSEAIANFIFNTFKPNSNKVEIQTS